MPSNIEVLGANCVALLAEPLTRVSNINTFLARDNIEPLMKQPLEVSQGVVLDPSVGAIGNQQIESMRSQMALVLSALRIEAHDRSGNDDVSKSRAPELFAALMEFLGVGVKGVGTNLEVVFTGTEKAGVLIGRRVLVEQANFIPSGMHISAGSARLYLQKDADDSTTYNLSIEPRGQDLQTDRVFMSCNAHLNTDQMISAARLHEMLRDCSQLVGHVMDSLFADSQ